MRTLWRRANNPRNFNPRDLERFYEIRDGAFHR
jgi:hypothetical protein